MSVPIALCSLRLFGYMALTDKLAGDYRSQRRYSADKKRYPSGLVSDKTPTPFYGSGGKQFLCCRGLRRWGHIALLCGIRITRLLSCDLSESSVADGGYHCL